MLAARLERWRDSDALVLALPRGGVPVAAEIARALGLELGLALVRKIGVPGNPELAVAALAGPGGETLVVNPAIARAARLDGERIEALAVPQRAELERRAALWLGNHPTPALTGRTVLLVDDGLATGATMRAALTWARGHDPARLIVVVPVGAADTLDALEPLADDILCPLHPQNFRAEGLYYQSFDQVADADVARLLQEQHGPRPDPG